MEAVELKLKQASAVLGVAPKDLQNLVQFGVLRPTRRDSIYWFDNRLLLEAKIALYLKDSLGTSTDVLTLFARALSSLSDERVTKARYQGARELALPAWSLSSSWEVLVHGRRRELFVELVRQISYWNSNLDWLSTFRRAKA